MTDAEIQQFEAQMALVREAFADAIEIESQDYPDVPPSVQMAALVAVVCDFAIENNVDPASIMEYMRTRLLG